MPREPMVGELSVQHSDGTTEHIGKFDLAGEIPEVGPKNIPQDTIDELVAAKLRASDLAGAFGDAVKAQAEKWKVKPGALRRYVTAIAADKLEDVKAETTDLDALLES